VFYNRGKLAFICLWVEGARIVELSTEMTEEGILLPAMNKNLFARRGGRKINRTLSEPQMGKTDAVSENWKGKAFSVSTVRNNSKPKSYVGGKGLLYSIGKTPGSKKRRGKRQ